MSLPKSLLARCHPKQMLKPSTNFTICNSRSDDEMICIAILICRSNITAFLGAASLRISSDKSQQMLEVVGQIDFRVPKRRLGVC